MIGSVFLTFPVSLSEDVYLWHSNYTCIFSEMSEKKKSNSKNESQIFVIFYLIDDQLLRTRNTRH